MSEHSKLTNRETLVLNHIVEGLPNKAIAGKLGVSVKTVINHRANLYAKLNVHCTAELIKRAVRLKLITMEGEIK